MVKLDKIPEIVFLVGGLALYDKQVRSKLNMSLFIKVDADERLCHSITKGIDSDVCLDALISDYITFSKPSFDDFVLPVIYK